MGPNLTIKPNKQIKAFYLFFLLISIQTGVGIMGVPHHIFLESKHDAWISVLIAGAALHLVVMVMFFILKQYKNADIVSIQTDIFGKWIGKLLGSFFIVYFFVVTLSVLVDYIEVVQVFIFPTMSPWVMSILMILLTVYTLLGGIRVVVGLIFIFFFFSLWLLIFLYKSVILMDLSNFLPIFQATTGELLSGAYKTSFSYVGVELIFFIYPFIQDKQSAHKSAQLGVAFTTFLLLLVTVISIGYFSPLGLETLLWPVLVLFKIIEYAIIGRFDVLVVTAWFFVVLPSIVLFTWITTYTIKRTFRVQQKKAVYFVALLLIVLGALMKDQTTTNFLTDLIARVGFWVGFIYPLVLYPLVLIKKKAEKKRRAKK
ncbi:GerAB/ArcD/ProY family transporter [Sediminibacillus massiliensis]|uniref:GerAB/ArcD/ProY family transporter n=1 Tax=Sediminibacillus massiliensis TaxID=1926277 RepID=UPI0009888FD5|nr:GerAB/ArcD/ProY family transporter [Sediminibacillus massiliensis]